MFNSLVGFALDLGDRLLINGEEVAFKGWVDQSQTAISVKAIADSSSPVKQIRAKEIKSLSRSQDIAENKNTSSRQESAQPYDSPINSEINTETVAAQSSPELENQSNSDRVHVDQKPLNDLNDSSDFEEHSQPEEIPEVPQEPEYNAWEVWTYLERQRLKTLKLINTFRAEWEANRFVREAERSAPTNLRVHYEIRPVLLDEAEMNSDYQNTRNSYKSQDSQPDHSEENYADAIDVEIIM